MIKMFFIIFFIMPPGRNVDKNTKISDMLRVFPEAVPPKVRKPHDQIRVA